MFTTTADLMLPSAVTGSWPRPRWFDVSLWVSSLTTGSPPAKVRLSFLHLITNKMVQGLPEFT